MKSIKKLTNKVTNNVSGLAGSALLVGATLTGGAAFAAAQSGSSGASMDLGDYPQPFVSEDGEVETSIVLGSDAKVTDVVGAVEIAGSLGMNAFGEEAVSVSGGTAGTWAADNGLTLNRRNSNLFLTDNTGDGQTRLDASDVTALEDTTLDSADNNEVDVEHDVTVGSQDQRFSVEGDYDNPVLNVKNPYNSLPGDSLFNATVDFSDSIDFTTAGDSDDTNEAEEYLEDGDKIELFGTEYSFSDESGDNELVLYGSSDRVEVNTGESTTVTVDGEEVQVEVSYVGDADTATVSVAGQTESVSSGDSVGPSGNIRVSDIYQTGPDGQGRVAFSQGSDELVIDVDNNEVDVDGETVDGVWVNATTSDGQGTLNATESLEFAFGAADSDENFIEAGEMYEDPVFGLQFHYGGLNPDVSDEDNAAEVIEVDAPEEDVAEVTFTTADGEEATVPVHTYSSDVDSDETAFGPEDGTIAQYEGQKVKEDDMVVLNAFEEADMYEVTDVSDSDLGTNSEGSVSVTLENVASGDTVTIEEQNVAGSELASQPYKIQDESIEGKDFDVTFHNSGEVSFVRSTAEGQRQLYPAMYTATDSAIAFDASDGIDSGNADAGDNGIQVDNVFSLPSDGDFNSDVVSLSANVDSTSGTNDYVAVTTSGTGNTPSSATLNLINTDGDVAGTADLSGGHVTDANVSLGSDSGDTTVQSVEIVGADGGLGDVTVSVNGDDSATATNGESAKVSPTVEHKVELPSGIASNDAMGTVTFTDTTDTDFSVSVDSDFVQYELVRDGNDIDLADRSDGDDTGVLLAQPENDDDQEEAYVIEANSENSGQADVNHYTGTRLGEVGLDSEDVNVAYDEFGAYTSDDEDSSNSQTLSVNMPSGQATAGMAVTGADGSISADGSSGGSATAAQPTYQYADGVLANDGNVGQVKNNENVVLVGGPNANSLVQELVDDNQTMAASEYTEGQGMIQMVDGFSEGNNALVVAGYSGEDTREAAEFLADYRNNQGDLEGQEEVTIETSSGTVVE